MLKNDRKARIDAATKALYDYIDSLPPEKRVKALEYQAEITRKAAKSPGGMLDVCVNEMKRLNGKLNAALSGFVDAIKEKESEIVLDNDADFKAKYNASWANDPMIHTSCIPSWEELSPAAKQAFKDTFK